MTQDFSKSQRRAATLLNIAIDEYWSYGSMADRLAAAGVPGDGIPAGHTWRSASKLGDGALLSALRHSFDGREVETLREARGD